MAETSLDDAFAAFLEEVQKEEAAEGQFLPEICRFEREWLCSWKKSPTSDCCGKDASEAASKLLCLRKPVEHQRVQITKNGLWRNGGATVSRASLIPTLCGPWVLTLVLNVDLGS